MLKIWVLAVFQPIFASPLPATYQLPSVHRSTNTAIDYSDEVEPRISYAKAVRISDYPYFVHLQCCGGAILTNEWVVTAAHCVTNTRNAGKCISVGKKYAEIEDIIVHPGYVKSNGVAYNDIALVKLANPLEFDNMVQPVMLPEENHELNVGSKHVFVGMGADKSGRQSKYLKKVDVTLYPTKVCYRESYSSLPRYFRRYLNFLNKSTMCAKRVDRPTLANIGDFGGPVVKDNVLVGIASYAISPRHNNRIILSNVAHYVDWIKFYTEYDNTGDGHSSLEESSEESSKEFSEEIFANTSEELTKESSEETEETSEEFTEETSGESSEKSTVESSEEFTEETSEESSEESTVESSEEFTEETSEESSEESTVESSEEFTEETSEESSEESTVESFEETEETFEESSEESTVESSEETEETSEEFTEETEETEETSEEFTEETEETSEEFNKESLEETSEELSEELTKESFEETKESSKETTVESSEEITIESSEETDELTKETSEEFTKESSEKSSLESSEETTLESSEETTVESSEELTIESSEETEELTKETSEELNKETFEDLTN